MELVFVVSERKQAKAALVMKVRPTLQSVLQWICKITKGFFSAMFVPSITDQQIEQSRERVRQMMARTY